jgi:tetratricopeptide (TPR) repeat protein
VDERWQIGNALSNLGLTYSHVGDYAQAERLLTESVKIQRSLGDGAVAIVALGNLGWVHLHYGDYERATALFQEFLDRNRAIGDRRNEGHALRSLGWVAALKGDDAGAISYYRDSLDVAQELNDRPCIVRVLACWTGIAANRADWTWVARLAGLVAAQRQLGGVNVSPDEEALCERTLSSARAKLDEPALASALEKGRAMPLKQAIAYVQSG